VLEDFNFKEAKTKELVSLRNKLKLEEKKLLLVLFEQDKNIYLSARNLQDVKVITVSELNTYDIMNSSVIMFNESSLNNLQSKN
jgi:large subunit ribosomal protein L4